MDTAPSGGHGTNLTVGRNDGATGSLEVTNSIIDITSDNNYAGFSVGRDAGHVDSGTVPPTITKTSGIATFGTGAQLNLDGGESSLHVGRGTNTMGVLTFENGAQSALTGSEAWLNVGREAGSEGTMNITSGAAFTMTSDGQAL